MVLINGYTISKSYVDDYTPDSVVDGVREPEPGRKPRAHHGRRDRRGHADTTLADKTNEPATIAASFRDSLWKRFRHRNRTTKSKHPNKYGIKADGLHNNYFGKKRHNDKNQKREISTEFVSDKGFFKNTKDFFANTKNNQLKFFNLTTAQTSTFDNMTSVTSSLSTSKSTQTETTATTLSKLQSLLDSKKSITSLKDSTTAEWVGTAQLEALLENIKARAMQILVDNNPTVTSLITNSVNEITFEADPILRHIAQTTPHPKAAAILRTSNIHKQTTEGATDTTHNIQRRSPTEAISTITHSVEDALQNELKKVYKKLKCKVSSYHKVKSAATTKHYKTTHTLKKTSRTTTAAAHTAPMKTVPKGKEKSPEMKPHHLRVAKATRRFNNKKKVTSTTTTAEPNPLTSIDDSKLIGLLEQMLLKTSEYNVMTMMPTPFTPQSKIERLSKRNVETLADLKLKEQVEGYEHGELMPDVLDNDEHDTGTTSGSPDIEASTFSTHGISFESISDKISYNDYVNGYKYYLKYQQEQEQDDEKFSPMIRYQAHKHHKVDDIGKYILGKIPQIRFARNIFDEIDMDDQDISTKSDDSWFKKHFYMFLDSNTPKKFHTSETVSLKGPLTEPSMDPQQPMSMALDKPAGQSSRPPLSDHSALLEDLSEFNLDQLAQNLEGYKSELSSTTMSSLVKKLIEEGKEEPVDSGFMVKMMSRLLGGKDRRALRKGSPNVVYQPDARYKRNAKKSKYKETHGKTTTQKITLNEPGMPEHKDKFGKLGVVQMIAQPTTVVKIPTKKKSKLKNFMQKFRFNKKGNTNKAKRHAIRKQRFVPFKRIKEILLGSEHESHGTARSKVVNDFDIMTSEIDTFKAVKFTGVPNVDEMRKEIPDITEDLLAPDIVYSSKSATRPAEELDSRTHPALDFENSDLSADFLPHKSQAASKVTNEIQQMTMKQLEHYLVDYKKDIKGTTAQIDNILTKSAETLEKASVQTPKNLENEDVYALEDLEAQNNIKEDQTIKLIKPEVLLETKGSAVPELNLDNDEPAQESMDVIREEIDKLQNKLTMYESVKNITENQVKPNLSDVTTVTKVMFVPARIQKLERKNTELENKGTKRNKKNNIPKAADPKIIKPKREVTDLESAIESPNTYEYSEEGNYKPIKKFSIPFIPIRRDSSQVSKKTNSMPIEGYSLKKTLSQYSVSPDHFGELLLWHSDILNVDLLTTTTYVQWVDKDSEMSGYTTPNAALLANEVQDMKRFLSNLQPVDYVKKASSNYKTTTKRSTNTEKCISMPASTAMKDDYSVGENEVVVLGQAQYFSFSKDESLDYGSGPNKAEKPIVEKKKKNEASAQPILKQISVRSNWTNLFPRPNVMYNTSLRSRHASRLWRKPTRQPLAPTNKLLACTKPLTPTSRTNQAPEQYFSTPLPMDSQDFEEFLKKSHLDVDSVTAPISDSEVNISSEKLHVTATINDLKVLPSMKATSNAENISGHALRLKSEKEYLIKALNQLKLSAKNLSQITDDSNVILSEDFRFRRHDSDSKKISNAPLLGNKVMKRRRIFGKQTSAVPGLDLSDYNDPLMPNKNNVDYEVKYSTDDMSKYTPDKPQTVNVEMTKLNNLLYFYIPGKMKNLTTSTTESVLAATEQITMELPKDLPEELTTEIPKLIRNLGLKHNNNPKRVRISYHYDVVYENRPKKARTRGPVAKNENVVHNSEVEEVTTRRTTFAATSTSDHKNSNIKRSQSKQRLSKHYKNGFKRKSKRNVNSSITKSPILSKRNINPVTYTAQNVAAFEIYFDLAKSTQTTNLAPVPEINALQVHIALPKDEQNIIKRQLNPSKPVFSARMSDAVNLEYQVPALEEKLTTESHPLSPGLYMLVDNMCKAGHVTLKPVLSDLSVLRPRQAVTVKVTPESTSQKCATTNNLNELKKVTLNKDFIAAVNKHLVQLYENFSSLNSGEKNVKKSAIMTSDVRKNDVPNRERRDIWPTLKEMLGGERTCSCHFKENHTLCPACVATDAVVEEIIFEFNNLANFMKDHCTEIQTFFWMNPNGGKKLTDSVHRLDRMLHDYYKRVKGKCQGKTCQALASRLDKRTLNNRKRIVKEVRMIPEDVQAIANNIANILKHRLPYSKNLKKNGEEFLSVVDNCLPGLRYKKSVSYQKVNEPLDDAKHKISDKVLRYNHFKHLKVGKEKLNYKREATQIEKPIISDSGGSYWSDYINKCSTEQQYSEQNQHLMTETTLNALTHNINELFLLFNNLNLTDVDPLTKLVENDKPQNKKKDKKAKKKKKKPKKPKKKHKTIHRLHKKIKEKKPKENANFSNDAVSIDTLMSMATEKSPTTRALRVILSNVQESPSLYVKVDKIAANTSHPTVLATAASNRTTGTNPTLTHKVLSSGNPEVLTSGETIIYEEGCGVKNNFLSKLKHLFNSNNDTYTPRYNYVYEKRSAGAPNGGLEKTTLTGDVSVLATTKIMTAFTSPSGDPTLESKSENIARIDEPSCPPSDPTCKNDEPQCSSTEEPKCPKEESTCPSPEPCKDKEPTCPPNETVASTGSLPTSTESPTGYESPEGEVENVITELTEQTYPTIIIIDEASTETATDDVSIDIMPSSNADTKDLLLSVLNFEKQKLDDEFEKVRDSRQLEEEKETNDKLVEQILFSSTRTTKSRHLSSFVTGNYSMLSDLVHASKMIRKGHQKSSTTGSTKSSTKTSTKSTTSAFTAAKSLDTYDKWRTWVNDTEKSESKVTSTTAAPAKLTPKVPATPHAHTSTSAVTPSTLAAANPKALQKKASDARPVPLAPHVCDISATIEHILELQHRLTEKAFEEYVGKLNCYRFRETPQYFVIAEDKKLNNSIAMSKSEGQSNLKLKWDWIRNQRQALIPDKFEDDTELNSPENHNTEPTFDNMLVNFVVDDDFEKFYKGEHGIYKMANSKRKKRKADAMNLARELTNLPPLHSSPNEILAMSGDPVILQCATKLPPTDRNPRWTADPQVLLRRPNVKMDGETVRIDGVEESNAGYYVCKEVNSESKRVQLRVLAVPDYQINFTPMYSIHDDSCGYNDLRAVRSLAPAMSRLQCPGKHCSMTVHDPDCLKDRSKGSALLRASSSLVVPPPGVRCSAGCRRDLAARLARMAVEDVPKLVTITVLIEGSKNKTLVPFTGRDGSFAVTRRLRRKGSARERRHEHIAPGHVEVVVKCPRRYHLLSEYKLCVADPSTVDSRAKRRERPSRRPRRYEAWWWYPPCGRMTAAAACAACAVAAHLTSRHRDGHSCRAARRPTSPSRVILARLFKRSLSAFRHTDSQETRSFPTKRTPPPLPPIDFD